MFCLPVFVAATRSQYCWGGYDPVEDPGFPQGGAANPSGGANIQFCQILDLREGARPTFYYVDSPLVSPRHLLSYDTYLRDT